MSKATPRLESAVRDHLAPLLRDDGFVGSSRTFRRIVGDLIQVIQVQGARYGGRFAINLGIQPTSIPDVSGNPPDATRIKVELCEFRRRLSETGSDQWWDHDGTRDSMSAAVQNAASLYAVTGRSLFTALSGPASPLHTVTPVQFETGQYGFSGFSSTKVRMARSLALMRQSQGNLADAGDFARIALANLGAASALRAGLELLCN